MNAVCGFIMIKAHVDTVGEIITAAYNSQLRGIVYSYARAPWRDIPSIFYSS